MKKAVFFDIDGTLIHSTAGIKDMTIKVKQAVNELKEQGNEVWIATGRPYGFLPDVILRFGFDGLILANGAHIVYQGQTIYNDPMDKQFVYELIDLFEEHNIQYILEGDHYCYMKEKFKRCGDLYEEFGVKREMLLPEYDVNQIDVYKMEFICPSKEVLDLCLAMLNQHPEYDYYHSMSLLLLEVYPKKNTKATAIHKVLDMLQIPWNQSYAFGDGKNDIEMLQAVEFGIAMGNAAQEVKQHANYVTDSVKDDGVATGIYKYILGQERSEQV